MLLYLDTSSLVKLYVDEDGSVKVETLVEEAYAIATSIVAYAEARSAFARRFREKSFTPKEYYRIKDVFEKDWSNYLIFIPNNDTIKLAGNLAERHALRGFDSIHLASALMLQAKLSSSVTFSCFDENLQKASKREGLEQN
jgi:uncharacterized protein